MLSPLPGASTPPIPLCVVPDAAEAFLLHLAEALHAHGASAHRLEAMLTLVARRLGIEARFYSTPTALLVSFGPVAAGRTSLVRVQPGATDLEKLTLLQEAAVRVIHGDLGVADGSARIAAIVGAPPRYGAVASTVAFALSSASAAIFFGGGRREVLAALVVGLAVGLVVRASGRWSTGMSIVEPLGAAVAAVLAAVIAHGYGPLSTIVVTLAGVVTLLPGLGFTTALTEIATRNLASGTARFAGAAAQLLGLAFGVGLGVRAAAILPPLPAPPVPVAWSPLVLAAAVVASGLAFAVLLRAHPRDLGWVLLGAGVSFAGARAGAVLVGPELGAFAGALLAGLAANAFARAKDRPSAVVLVPGLLVLVPGSLGFRSVVALLDNDVLAGVAGSFDMVLVAVSLAAGILLATLVLPPKRAL